MADFNLQPVFDALRTLIRTTWGIANSTPILFSGDEALANSGRLPAAFVELDPATIESGETLKSLRITFNAHVWLARKKTAGLRDTETMAGLLAAFAAAYEADLTLGGVAANAQEPGVVTIDFAGSERENPFQGEQGQAAHSGYVTIRVSVEQSR